MKLGFTEYVPYETLVHCLMPISTPWSRGSRCRSMVVNPDCRIQDSYSFPAVEHAPGP